jgi:xylulose-5-phosphate/fructose-6-phosphate phosphoketolase
VRVVNVVDLMCLQPRQDHPHGWTDTDFDALFTTGKPVIFAFHGYPTLIHRLTYKRTNHGNFHVHGYKGEGTTTTPFDMVVMNRLDRFHLAMDAVSRLPALNGHSEQFRRTFEEKLQEHQAYVEQHGQDLPEIRNWKWHGQLEPKD